MSYRVTIHSAAPAGHHGTAKIVTFEHRAEAERYRREALAEQPDATTHVTGQHEEPAASLEQARAWMAHLNAIWAAAPAITDHKHVNGWEHCPICGRNVSHNDLGRSL